MSLFIVSYPITKQEPEQHPRFLRESGGLGKYDVVESRELFKSLAYYGWAQGRLVDVRYGHLQRDGH